MICMELTRTDTCFQQNYRGVVFCAEMKVVQTPRNFLRIFYGPEDHQWARAAPGGCPKGAQPTSPGAPRWVVPTSVASRTPSWHYKFPNIPKPFGVTLDQKFCRRKAL